MRVAGFIDFCSSREILVGVRTTGYYKQQDKHNGEEKLHGSIINFLNDYKWLVLINFSNGCAVGYLVMRGFYSFVLVVGFLFVLLHLQALANSAYVDSSETQQRVLFLEKKYFIEQSIKANLRQAMASASGKSRLERVASVARALYSLESSAEIFYAEDGGVQVDLWAGVLTDAESFALQQRMLAERKALKCVFCFDLKAEAAATAFLDDDVDLNQIKISRNGAGFSSDYAFLARKPGVFALGASVFFPEQNASAVFWIPESVGEEYG